MKSKIAYIMLVVSILSAVDTAYAWSNGPDGGHSIDANNVNIGTHDLILNSSIDMLPTEMKSQIDIVAADYGSEMPNYDSTICNCTYGIGDKGKHHVYYNSDGTVNDVSGAERAQAEYDLAMANLSVGDKYNFSIHLGIMSHYITDVADYGHTMINESSDANVEFEHYVNTYPDQFFNSEYVEFDGTYENTTAYNATIAVANDTTFDNKFGKGIYTNTWMDNAMNSSSGHGFDDVNFTNRTRQSINYGANVLADVIYTMILSNATPEVTTTPTPTPTPVRHSSSSGSSGSSGGGGGGISSLEPYSNIFKYESKEEFIGLKPVTFRYSTLDLAIYEVIVTGNNSDSLTLRIEVLRNTSKLVGEPAPGVVYKNINIWPNSKRIKNATIKYKVQNSWMKNNSLSATHIKMFRWDNSSKKWIELETRTTVKDDIYTYVESDTDSLYGSFAISGIRKENAATDDKSSKTDAALKEEVKQTENKPVKDEEKKAPGFETMISIISIVSMMYIFRRVKR